MKIGNRQMERVEQAIYRRIHAKYEAEANQLYKQYQALEQEEKAKFTAAVQKQHAGVFKKLDAIKEKLAVLDKQRAELKKEMEEVSVGLLAHFEHQYSDSRVADFDRPRFVRSEQLKQMAVAIDAARKKVNSVSQHEIDEVILRLTLADEPEVKAILAEYNINL